MKEYLLKYVGQPMLLVGVRFKYRGVVTEVFDDSVILSNAYVVFQTGALNNEKADTEESCISTVAVALGAIESATQLVLCFYGLKK